MRDPSGEGPNAPGKQPETAEIQAFSVTERIPSLRGQWMKNSLFVHQMTTFGRVRHMSDDGQVGIPFHLVMIVQWDGEKQLIILSPVQRARCRIQFEIASGAVRRGIDR